MVSAVNCQLLTIVYTSTCWQKPRRELAAMVIFCFVLFSSGAGAGAVSVQVPLLLSMGENELGLKKAILSGEDDLVYLAVMHIEREAGSSEKGREAFFELMHAHPEALRLLKVTTV